MTDSAIGAPEMDQQDLDKRSRLVILASSVGTVIEWYDFYLYGSLAAIITAQFFSGVNETTGYIFALMAFAAGFAVRPFGAILFGPLRGGNPKHRFPRPPRHSGHPRSWRSVPTGR
jgi:hypothetical protein